LHNSPPLVYPYIGADCDICGTPTISGCCDFCIN